MRPHCQFCNKPLVLIRKNDVRYQKNEQLWECTNHPAVTSVISYIYFRPRSARSGGEDGERIYGTVRQWRDTVVTWTLENGRTFEAHYFRQEHDLHPSVTVPSRFYVNKLPLNRHEKLTWEQKQVLVLESHPTNINPENIINKVQTYVVFS